MTSEEKVKQLWPKAHSERLTRNGWSEYRVTITLGRYAYGDKRSQAWKNAWDSIIQDEELYNGEKESTHG